jgi:integrase
VGQSKGKLTIKGIARLTDKGRYGDGRGLYLQVVPNKQGKKLIRSWLFRYQVGAVEKVMGLGPLDDVSLDQAREIARQQRELLRQGIDPVAHRDKQRAERVAQAQTEAARSKTFADAAEMYYRQHSAKWKSVKHAKQFLQSLETHAYPILGRVRVADINRDLVLKVLLRDDFWQTKTQTASRVRGRIEAILNFAKVNHWRAEGENPASWHGNLQHALPARNQIATVEHHPAMRYAELPAFMTLLRQREGVAARALEFTILTAARTNEVLIAEWSEIDFDGKAWTRPAEHMKGGKAHSVPLADRAVQILKTLPLEEGNPYIFIGTQRGAGLSNASMTAVLKRMKRTDVTTHGFRSSFKDWCSETTNYAREISEMALAHSINDKVEAAYRRGELLQKRARLMAEWDRYLRSSSRAGAVIPIRGR